MKDVIRSERLDTLLQLALFVNVHFIRGACPFLIRYKDWKHRYPRILIFPHYKE
jgi:hypothetical protein